MSDAPAATVTENGVPPVVQSEEAPAFKVFAGNLAYDTTDEGLKAFFAPVQSDILSSQIVVRGHQSAGYGFVAFSTAEAAQNAVQLLDKKELDGRAVIVEIAKPADQKDRERRERRFKPKRRFGRRGSRAVPGEVSEAEANGPAPPLETDAAGITETSASADPAGADVAPKPKKKKKGPRKPRARPEAEATDAPADAVTDEAVPNEAENESIPVERISNRPPRTRRPRAPRRPVGEDPLGEPSRNVLFVANLAFSIDDAGLAALFTDAGIIVNSARIVRKPWGQPRKSKGFGFVDVGSEEEQQKAIDALDRKEIGGRIIAVKIAVNPPPAETEAETVPAEM